MTFIARKLTPQEQALFRDYRVNPKDAAVDDERNAIVVARTMHGSVERDDSLILYFNKRLFEFVFVQSPKTRSTGDYVLYDSPRHILENKADWFYEAKWVVPEGMLAADMASVADMIVEAVRFLRRSGTSPGGIQAEIKLSIHDPNVPPTLEELIARVNTVVALFHSNERLKLTERSPSPARELQEAIQSALQGTALRTDYAKNLMLRHLHESGGAGLTPEARLALKSWKTLRPAGP